MSKQVHIVADPACSGHHLWTPAPGRLERGVAWTGRSSFLGRGPSPTREPSRCGARTPVAAGVRQELQTAPHPARNRTSVGRRIPRRSGNVRPWTSAFVSGQHRAARVVVAGSSRQRHHPGPALSDSPAPIRRATRVGPPQLDEPRNLASSTGGTREAALLNSKNHETSAPAPIAGPGQLTPRVPARATHPCDAAKPAPPPARPRCPRSPTTRQPAPSRRGPRRS